MCAGQGPPQRLICHDLLKISKYDYTYEVKYNSVTLERLQCMTKTNEKNQIGQKDKSFSNLKGWESTLVSYFMIILMIMKPYHKFIL